MNELAIVGQVTDQRMLAHEVELLLLVGVTLEQSPQGAQVIAARGGGQFTGPLDGRARMAAGQAEQALQYAHSFNAAHGNDRLGPARAVRAQPAYLAQKPGGAAFDAVDLLRVNMLPVGTDAPRRLRDVPG